MDNTKSNVRVNSRWEENRIANGLAPWSSVSFSMGGWLQFYLYGVARAMQARGLDKDVVFCGCSAGALAATGLVLGSDYDVAVEFAKSYCIPKAYTTISGLFQLTDFVNKCLDRTARVSYKDRITPGKLQISVTKLPFLTSERVTSFDDYEDLRLTLLSSIAAVPFANIIKRKGSWYMDGGLSEFQPIIDDDTLTVSAFYFSDADIKPSRYVPLWWSFLPPNSPDTVDWLYCLGWEDANAYFNSRNIPQNWPTCRDVSSFSKSPHPFDTPKRVTLHRLLGYDYSSVPAHIAMFVLDLGLLMLYCFLFKPLALTLIYAELIVRVIVYGIVAVVGEVLEASVVRLLATIGNLLHMGYIGEFIHTTKRSTKTNYRLLFDCIKCLSSLSLFLRFLSFRPSNAVLKKHKRLEKLSLSYRIFRHII